ncbi:MAG TPA: ATP-binding protein [Rugosimonospora sp.]|nr:ATP-binding protein [Rugosimonospora sp.]
MDTVAVRVDSARHYAVVRAGERIDHRCVPALRAALDKALRDWGTALIDAGGVRVAEPICAALLPAVLSGHGGWPWARLAMFGAGPDLRDLLARTRASQLVPGWDTEEQALSGIALRPPWVRRSVTLAHGASAPAGGRAALEEACLAWRVPSAVRQSAALIASELVTNAVQHAGTDARLTLDCTRRTLRVSVRDFARRVEVRMRTAGTPRGGLAVVDTLAYRWGVAETTEGKSVWARLPLAPRRPVR